MGKLAIMSGVSISPPEHSPWIYPGDKVMDAIRDRYKIVEVENLGNPHVVFDTVAEKRKIAEATEDVRGKFSGATLLEKGDVLYELKVRRCAAVFVGDTAFVSCYVRRRPEYMLETSAEAPYDPEHLAEEIRKGAAPPSLKVFRKPSEV